MDWLFATLVLNGMHPFPRLRDYWASDKFTFGDTTIRKMWGGGATGYRRIEMLKMFLRFNDPQHAAAHEGDDSLALVRQLMDMLLHGCETAFEVGKDLSCDEVVFGFQGKTKNKETVKYKNEGDGFVLDALATSVEGALITFRSRKDSVEQLRRDHPSIYAAAPELAPLHLRCMGLLSRPCVAGKWRRV